MSANNQLVILKENRKYEIWENHCVDNEFDKETSTRLAFATSLRKAIIFAKKYCDEEMVEYGFTIWESALK